MEKGTDTRSSRLFMVIALVLTASLFLGLLGVGGLVLLRLVSGPTDVAMPPSEPTALPTVTEAPTVAPPSPVPTATLTAAPTATLVVAAQTTPSPTVETPEGGNGQDGPGMSSPSPESPEMPQTGLGLLDTLGIGLALIVILAATRLGRHMKVGE